jgi:hypothetical protein
VAADSSLCSKEFADFADRLLAQRDRQVAELPEK